MLVSAAEPGGARQLEGKDAGQDAGQDAGPAEMWGASYKAEGRWKVNEEGLVANRLWGWEGREPSGEPQEPMHWGGAHPEAGRPSGRAE